jgi:hypothetical protein
LICIRFLLTKILAHLSSISNVEISNRSFLSAYSYSKF